jgi:hypothetical protein
MSGARRADDCFVQPRPYWPGVLALIVAAAVWAGSVSAHEPGVGRAVVTFPSRQEYVVDLTVDAASLLARLEILAREPRSDTLTASECAARIAALQLEFMKHVSVRFDGRDVETGLESVREAAGSAQPAAYPVAPEVLLRMRGRIPAGARSVTWRYDLTYSLYVLTLKAADGTENPPEWLEGGQESRSFPLDRIGTKPSPIRLAALAAAPILAKGFQYILFVLAIFTFSRHLWPILWQPTGPVD